MGVQPSSSAPKSPHQIEVAKAFEVLGNKITPGQPLTRPQFQELEKVMDLCVRHR